MVESRAAHRYAKAMLEIAHEQNSLDATVEDFRTLEHAIADSRELQNLLATPVIDAEKKAKLLGEIFQGKLGEITEKFLLLLTKKGRAQLLWNIAVSFRKQLDREKGIVTADVSSAVELNDELRKSIERRLHEMTGKTVSATYRIDEGLLGGFVARIDNRMMDASVRHQLERLHDALAEEAGTWTPAL